MPSLAENKATWDGAYDWARAGEEWSAEWGSGAGQWYFSILPRIHSLLPVTSILEIGPGFGRWTQFLVTRCKHLIVVDLSEQCIRACRKRFSVYSHVDYHVNDGTSLDFVPDNSIDLVFSFDSLVHAEEDVIAAYLEQLSRKLSPRGAGIIHHSNLGEYERYLSWVTRIPHRFRQHLLRMRIIEDLKFQWRAPTMTAAKFEKYAEKAQLECTSQEVINWQSKRLIDCISTFRRRGPEPGHSKVRFRNPDFMREAAYASSVSRVYGIK